MKVTVEPLKRCDSWWWNEVLMGVRGSSQEGEILSKFTSMLAALLVMDGPIKLRHVLEMTKCMQKRQKRLGLI